MILPGEKVPSFLCEPGIEDQKISKGGWKEKSAHEKAPFRR